MNMTENDVKQFIIDVVRENGHSHGRDKPRHVNGNQRYGPPRNKSDDFSKKILIFLSVLMFITSGFVKYMQLVEGIDVVDMKIPMALLYGGSIAFYQVRKGLEGMGKNGNGHHNGHGDNEYEEFENFD